MLRQLVFLVVLAIPTNILTLYATAGLQGVSANLRQLIGYGVIGGVTLTVFRASPFPFGLHVPLQALVMLYLTKRLTRGRWSVTVLGVLVIELLAAAGEGLIGVPIMSIMGIPLTAFRTNLTVQIAGGWVGNTLLIALCLVILVRRFYLERRGRAG